MSTDHSPRYGGAAPQTGPIVFVHGSLSSARIWAPYAAAMATRKTICIDLPGYGAEPAWPAEAPYRLNNAAATIKRALEGRSERADLVAHSFGAAVALR